MLSFSKVKHFSSKRYFQALLSKLLQNKFLFLCQTVTQNFLSSCPPTFPKSKKTTSRGCSFTPYILFEQILLFIIIPLHQMMIKMKLKERLLMGLLGFSLAIVLLLIMESQDLVRHYYFPK